MLSKKTIGFLLKIGIVAFALFFLFKQLTDKTTIDQFNSTDIINQIKEHWFIMVIVLFMMFLNWFLEALKWQFLIKKIENISFLKSIRAVFSGITVSAFTPNRVGEYGGRVFCLDTADRIQAVLITVIGSMAQLLTTIFFGSVGILLLPKYLPEFPQILSSINLSFSILVFLTFLVNSLLVFLFLNTHVLSKVLSKIKFLNKYEKYNTVFSFYTTKELAKVLLFSVVRYAVFTTQFFILLLVFGVEISYLDAIVLIMTMLFVISIIPTIAITEIGVRGSVAIFLFGLVSFNTIGIISATLVLWIINLLLPALIGTLFIFSLKFFRK